jgi:predicted DCC family thiol-disulfide oxidoreductase YuxK
VAHPVILFDGVCNLCNSSVDFVIDRDPEARFRFASLQEETGRDLLRRHDLAPETMDSVVLIEEERVYIRSTAALRIAHRLPFPWPLFSVFFILPAPLRDFFYDLIARNRYRWFGRRETCRMPTPELQARFLD